MNLDLLIKLVKLANNNPNEHEANSAARRACKLIAEGNYQFSEVKKAADKVNINWENQGSWSNPYDDLVEMMRKQKENIRQEDERRRRQNQQRTHEPGFNYRPSQAQQDFYNQQNAYRPGRGFEGQENVKKPKIRRVCTKCGLDVETSNMKDPFVCGVCIWNEYNEKRVNAEKAAYQKIKDYDF